MGLLLKKRKAVLARVGRALRRNERGQSVVEFAIALPLLLFIALGTVDVGRVFFDYIGLRAAAMDAALYGARFPDDEPGMRLRVAQSLSLASLPMSIGVTPSVSPSCKGATSLGKTGTVSVKVVREFRPVSLSALQFLASGMNWVFTISPTATARCMT